MVSSLGAWLFLAWAGASAVGASASPCCMAFTAPVMLSRSVRGASRSGAVAMAGSEEDRAGAVLSRLSRMDALKVLGVSTVGTGVLSQVQKVAAEPELVRVPLVNERIFDTSRRSYLPVEMDRLAHNKLMAQPVICVGEVHTDLSHHRAQLEILKAAHEKRNGPPVALGMEMFYRKHQDILDDFVFGSATLASLKEDTQWDKTWGHKLFNYSKLLQYAKKNKIRVVGLNVPVLVVQLVSRMGLSNIPAQLSSRLPEVDLSNKKHRANFMSMIKSLGAAHGAMPEDALARMYEAQTLWDEYMAESASNYLKENGGRIVVVAGSGHIQNRFGVPDRIAKRANLPVFTVVPVTVPFNELGLPEIEAPYGRDFADWVWYTQEQKAAAAKA